ncbi:MULTISPECIES: TlpA family protein disulfide reductase [Niastella]|uniref:Redoxin domain-containing protein n=1 Tax=Niastella soli TaxID=2821487 RepID=A0ABS3YV53_9BACT|nr:redoxin domain-containing protein [Niastella soli]MBO9201071.1 redoxin domain-containing protein [Niastella soli]
MRNRLFLLILAFTVKLASAQTSAPDSPAYKRFPTIPPFTILQTDSTNFTKENLKHHQPTLIMYFSPDCDHCKHQWAEMEKKMKELKKYQIVMVTYQPFDEMVEFYKEHKIAEYPNIKMGRDTKFFLPPFFKIKSLPFQALYDKKGELITTFDGNVEVNKVLQAFNAKD